MSGLPTQIPQQSVPIGNTEDGKAVYAEFNWFLFLYNLSQQIFGSGGSGGTTPVSPYDVLDNADLVAATSDIPQAYRGISNIAERLGVGSLADGADVAKVRHELSNVLAFAFSPALPDPTPEAQPVQSVTAGTSPFTYTALANGLLSITGGAVSAVSIIRQGVTVATGIGSSSSTAISSFTDEKGSGGQPGFVAGVDFTPGTTTSLTLSGTYASAADLWVAFDPLEQGANTYSLSGKTLTFNAPIPVGTGTVFVKGANGTSISSSGGLVPVRRLDQVQITYSAAPTIAFLPD